jgi:hypothetical protein
VYGNALSAVVLLVDKPLVELAVGKPLLGQVLYDELPVMPLVASPHELDALLLAVV